MRRIETTILYVATWVPLTFFYLKRMDLTSSAFIACMQSQSEVVNVTIVTCESSKYFIFPSFIIFLFILVSPFIFYNYTFLETIFFSLIIIERHLLF